MLRKITSIIFLFAFILVLPAETADVLSLESEVRALTRAVQELKRTVDRQALEIAELRGSSSAPVPTGLESSPAMPDRRVSAAGLWNPKIGVVADMVLSLDSPKSDDEGADRISVRELELVMGSAVDPFTRLDATLAISDFEEMSLEEAYITRFGLPLDSTARIGRFLPKFGKAIAIHRDALDTVDEPLVIQRWFGAEGYAKTGADWTVPVELPWDILHEFTVGVLEGGGGEGGTAFGTARRNPTIYSRLKNYVDLTDATGLEIGGNYLIGSRDDDEEFDVFIAGLDGTLIHRYGGRQSIKLQAEGYFMQREDSFSEVFDDAIGSVVRTEFDGTLWGAYSVLDWRISSLWEVGARYDYVQIVDTAVIFPPDGDDNQTGHDDAYSVFLTYHQSEFARWRLQYSYVELSSGADDNRVFLQGTFAIGEHKHKLK